jgi:hypothetical protein
MTVGKVVNWTTISSSGDYENLNRKNIQKQRITELEL